ncbi:MAG: hypothetical protein AMXMBFR64_00500 [Myxococcales bacterium]
MACRRLPWLVAALIGGCAGGSDPAPHEDAAPTTSTDTESPGADASSQDTGAVPASLPPEDPTATTGTPVLLGDSVILATQDGVSEPGAQLGFGGASVIEALAAADSEGASLFAVVRDGQRGRLRGLTLDGLAWELPAADTVRRPGVHGDRLLVVSRDGEAWRAEWVDRLSGAVLATHPFTQGPVTAPARLRSASTDWLVGAGHRLVVLRATEGGVASLGSIAETDTELARVTSVVTSGGWVVAATGWLDEAQDPGLGDALSFHGIGGADDAPEPFFIAHPAPAPGPILAPPVLAMVDVCQGGCSKKAVVSSGGSHWFGGWDAESGKVLWLRDDLPERVTSLSLGGGRIYSGGSHWHPGDAPPKPGYTLRGWTVVPPESGGWSIVEHLGVQGAPDALIVGVPSALVRAGAVTVVALPYEGPALLSNIADPLASPPACGWPRSFGDDLNAGTHVTSDPTCFGP